MTRYDIAIVGGGITGLTAAFEIVRRRPRVRLVLLEEQPQLGGAIRSLRRDGYTVDLGPNGFLDNGTDTRALADRLGLAGELRRATDRTRHRYLLAGGRLHAVPLSAAGVLATPLLPTTAKLRLLAEPLIPAAAGEETVFDFVARRLGRVPAERLAVPAVHGITAGEAAEVSLDALLPRVRELERSRHSLVVAAARARWSHWRRGAPAPKLTSFRAAGMQRLVDALAQALGGDRVRLGSAVRELDRAAGAANRPAADALAGPAAGPAPGEPGPWRLTLAGGTRLSADAVLLAVPGPAAAGLLGRLLPAAAATLAAVRYASLRVTALGYRRSALGIAPDGFGFLTCPDERVRVLGAVYASTVYPDQAPPGQVLLRSFAGGTADPDFAELPAAAAVAAVHRDLVRVLEIGEEPVFCHDHQWRVALPQYSIGHRSRMAGVLRAAAGLPGLHLAGSTYHGVAVNDCVRDARRAAEAMLVGS